ncbi:MAG: glycosyltransferase, exosortase A system-associated [Burkholderiaceae bacterium]|jgi:PEP-CTERM/exosortase A-associated glycosyltransferase|nr:glycosyltransferase, exosortase A system-associated [Burkholderiaceae bacterium]
MRILHILDHSLPLHSGYTFRTAAILREQRALGWQTLQLTTPRHGPSAADEEEAGGLRFMRTPFTPGWRSRLPAVGVYLDEMRATGSRLDQVIERTRPDVLHAHSPVLDALPAIAAGRRHGIPVVYEVRACWEDAAVDHGSTAEGSLRYRATRALETHALRRADAVTVICDGLRREFESRGIAADKITVIPNAVEVHNFRFGAQPEADLRRTLGLDGATVLGFLGSFYAYEGLDLLLDALPLLLPQRPQLRVLLVGGGPQDAALKAQAQRLGIADKVVFTGRVPHAEVQRYYDLVDLLAYPRHPMRLTDLVTPLKPLEAMAQGQILVASDVGGHRELIRDGDTGYLFAAGSAQALAQSIERALSLRPEWDAMRLRGRRFVEVERTWAHSVARYRDVYGRLLSPSAAAVAAS